MRTILDSLYTDKPDGLCGNDDCGQMSAWYVMSALGLYQVTPGLPMYCISAPLFPEAVIHLENGKLFSIRADNPAPGRFIQAAMLNGSAHSRSRLTHDELLRGGSLKLAMNSDPGSTWGTKPEDCPHTPSLYPCIVAPLISAPSNTFKDSLTISISSLQRGAAILYWLNGPKTMHDYTGPYDPKWMLTYTGPFTVHESCRVNAFADVEFQGSSAEVSAEFTQSHPVGSIRLLTSYSPQYTGDGDAALVDGLRGKTDFRLGHWQGYEGNDLEAVVDLGSVKRVQRVAIGCLQDNNAWIFLPERVTFAFSDDGEHFSNEAVVANPVSPKEEAPTIHAFEKQFPELRARYIRVTAKSIGVCPAWHKGAGGKAWLFADEILIDAH